LQECRCVAAQVSGKCPSPAPFADVLPAKQEILRVGDAGFEPATSAV
jgi:hypothetical protein